MTFNSVTFLAFLSIFIPIYWALPLRGRQWLIFASSLTFYGFWRPEFILVMLASASTDYFVALRMASIHNDRSRRRWLYISFVVNLGFLFYFKYLFFVVGSGFAALRAVGFEATDPILNIILPLGISFYTFETISYSVDVYRRTIKPERDFLVYACFITFFPKLIAGPILRAYQLIPQMKTAARISLEDCTEGIRRLAIGLFLKVGLADNIAPLVDDGFSQPTEALSALDVWTLAFLFGYQIYFDFSAYSHIAIGAARLIGIRLVENFNFPYLANSPRDFWQRWHISLSGWIRDYLYLPLIGTRPTSPYGARDVVAGDAAESFHPSRQQNRTYALFCTWAIMGLWHGANWTFLFWGLLHAAYIHLFRITEPVKHQLPTLLRKVGGFALTLPLVMVAWIAFRAPDLATMFSLYAKLFQVKQYSWLGMRENTYLVAAATLVLILCAPAVYRVIVRPLERHPATSVAVNALGFCFIGLTVFTFLRPISQFIYFAF
jgi:D-alanyl-lipoteichoic acid acyltransferase DltB (MBOAT superfamily)